MGVKYWKCPKCKREFSKKNQRHSCVRISAREFFKRKSKLKKVYNKFLKEIRKISDIKVDFVKTGINLGRKSHFGMLFLRKDYLRLDLLLDRKAEKKCIWKIEKYGNRFVCYIKLYSENDIDLCVLHLVKEACGSARQFAS